MVCFVNCLAAQLYVEAPGSVGYIDLQRCLVVSSSAQHELVLSRLELESSFGSVGPILQAGLLSEVACFSTLEEPEVSDPSQVLRRPP